MASAVSQERLMELKLSFCSVQGEIEEGEGCARDISSSFSGNSIVSWSFWNPVMSLVL